MEDSKQPANTGKLLSDAVGHCRTVGLSDCRTVGLSEDCRILSDDTVGLSDRGSASARTRGVAEYETDLDLGGVVFVLD